MPSYRTYFRRPLAAVASVTAREVAQAYNYPLERTGRGFTVGLVELGGGFAPAAFPGVVAVPVAGGQNAPDGPGGADGEVQLDITVVRAVAPGAAVRVYFAPNTDQGFYAAVVQACVECDVVSISWGGPESSWSPATMHAFDGVFAAARARGVTILAAAGDSGADDGTGRPTVDFPASSPNVIACGGTRLLLGAAGLRLSEVTWDDNPASSATGGGVSRQFPGRDVPDVAGNADPATGYRVTIDGQSTVIGGTSAVAPLYAGLALLLCEELGARVGQVADMLKMVTANPQVCFDVTAGDNGAYRAGPGRDQTTGFGVVDGAKLLAAYQALRAKPVTPPPSGTLTLQNAVQRLLASIPAGWLAERHVGGNAEVQRALAEFEAAGPVQALPAAAATSFRPAVSAPTGIDESYSFADVHELARRGIKIVMLYLSHTPAKNATAAKVKALHSVGIGVLLGFEDFANRALTGGYGGGLADGEFAAGQYLELIRQVGEVPRNVPAIPAAVDQDTNSTQWAAIASYFRGFRDGIAKVAAQKLRGGIYGEADILDEIIGRLRIVLMGFGTYAWSYGRISAWDDFHQFLNGQKIAGADVDFDQVLNATAAGAWWPANSPYNVPPTSSDPLEQIMSWYTSKTDFEAAVQSQVADAIAAERKQMFNHASVQYAAWRGYGFEDVDGVDSAIPKIVAGVLRHTIDGSGRPLQVNLPPQQPRPHPAVAAARPSPHARHDSVAGQTVVAAAPAKPSMLDRVNEVRKVLIAAVTVVAELAATGGLHGTAEAVAQSIVACAGVFGIYVVPNAAKA